VGFQPFALFPSLLCLSPSAKERLKNIIQFIFWYFAGFLRQGAVAAAKARRDDLCQALCALRDGGGGLAVGGVCGGEVAALVDQYEATKQSWADFWRTK
jgi:hypothetical protein